MRHFAVRPLRKKSYGIRNLPQQQIQEYQGTAWDSIALRFYENHSGPGPVESEIVRHAAGVALLPFVFKKKCSPSVVKVDAAKADWRLRVSVLDLGILDPKKTSACQSPAVAQVPIFGSHTKCLIKATDPEQSDPPHGHVVACKKIRVFRVAVEVVVNHLEDELARLGEEVVFQAIESGAADERLGMFAQGGDEFFKPGRRGEAVVVGEGEEFTSRLHHAPIARSGRASVLLADELEIELRGPARGIEHKRWLAAVVHHDHLETARRESLRHQGIETGFHGARAVAGRDDYAGDGSDHLALLSACLL